MLGVHSQKRSPIVNRKSIMPFYLNGRRIVYTNQVPFESDVLATNDYIMSAISALADTVLGFGISRATTVRGLACAPISPPGMSVTIGPGVMYSFEFYDDTDYGVIPADTNVNHKLYKQAFNWDPVNIPVAAPATPGDSVIYLIQGIFETTDVNNVSRPYFNSANPSEPIFNNNYDTRTDRIILSAKQGTPSPTPSPPTPDAGYTALYYVTVANGQTSIISGNIAKVSTVEGQPFITQGLTQKAGSSDLTGYVTIPNLQNATQISAIGAGTANAITAAPSPAYTSLTNAEISVYITTPNTNATTLAVSALGAVAVRKHSPSGLVALAGGEITSGWYKFKYDGTYWELLNPELASGTYVTPLQLLQNTYTSTDAAGAVNAYTATISSLTSYAGFTEIVLHIDGSTGTNTGPSTLNVNGGGAIPIGVEVGGIEAFIELSGGELMNGGTYRLIKYSSPDIWFLTNPSNERRIWGEMVFAGSDDQTVPAGEEENITYSSYGPDGNQYGTWPGDGTFEVKVAGRYNVTASIDYGMAGTGGSALGIAVNGTIIRTVDRTNAIVDLLQGSAEVNAEVGDIISARLNNVSGSLAANLAGTGPQFSYIQVSYLGPALGTPIP